MNNKVKECLITIAYIIERLLSIVPDKIYLRVKYFIHTKTILHLEHPETFNEKVQWLKLYDRKTLYIALVDKYEVRKYVSDKIGENYLIPLLGMCNRLEDIDFGTLPDQFVLKCTHDSGGV